MPQEHERLVRQRRVRRVDPHGDSGYLRLQFRHLGSRSNLDENDLFDQTGLVYILGSNLHSLSTLDIALRKARRLAASV